ncbi:hemerythrin domain-containing protein [Pseudonocardia asaccharolytica]|uniref:Hemerythrin n=1 Tax=Pseudonocardia asaccharolytica DSM 44247 = NBRC 16224 TaxID=1123024 RepID=A0A511CZT1_9PSEU|nr:hemerythrin domain-containing protein [Pseudonocardia asaccharolytica]GEL18055.1 hemerythrin [Pseudonocardia asaccharolytica DSM 44247 = NBRC 16224]
MCEYCGCRAITIIGRFSAEHDEIVNTAGELARAAQRGDHAAARECAHDLGHLLHPHTEGEERGLFAELRRDPMFTEHISTLCDEHDDLDARLDRIAKGELSGAGAFIDLLRRHIDREENGLFPAAAVAVDWSGCQPR